MNTPAELPASSDTGRRGATLTRRGMFRLGGLGLGALGLGGVLASCTTDDLGSLFSSEPDPSEVLLRVKNSLTHAAAHSVSNPQLQAFFDAQATAVNDELLRQCGVDDEGNYPPSCTDPQPSAESTPSAETAAGDAATPSSAPVPSPKDAYLEALSLDATSQPSLPSSDFASQASILTGLYAAFATTEDAADLAGVKAIDVPQATRDFKDTQGLTTMLELVFAAIYASGLVLAGDGGAHRGVLTAIASRLRTLRDTTADALRANGQAVPHPQAGYQLPEGQSAPSTAAEAATLFHEVLTPITAQLRALAGDTVHTEARLLFARWCGINARAEAAMEDILGEDPLGVTVRG